MVPPMRDLALIRGDAVSLRLRGLIPAQTAHDLADMIEEIERLRKELAYQTERLLEATTLRDRLATTE